MEILYLSRYLSEYGLTGRTFNFFNSFKDIYINTRDLSQGCDVYICWKLYMTLISSVLVVNFFFFFFFYFNHIDVDKMSIRLGYYYLD